MKTYVIIPHFIVTEELKTLAENAIKSFTSAEKNAIIISIDDGSPMDCSFLKELSTIYLKNEKNSGFAPTCNKGFQWVFDNEPDDCYIICANNDIEVNERVIPALIEPFELFDNVAITGILCNLYRHWDGTPLKDFRLGLITEGGLLRDRMQDGGLWCTKKSVLQKIGIFDEQFIRGGYEDVDLFLRARDTFGMKIVMSGHAAYWHKQGATRWNCENNNYINDFGRESKSIEDENAEKFKAKWGWNYHNRNPWRQTDLRQD